MPRRRHERHRAARFLADESFDFGVVLALRATSYNTKAIVELSPGVSDEAVIAMAVCEERVLFTEDLDFG